jgi:hypothetical protein
MSRRLALAGLLICLAGSVAAIMPARAARAGSIEEKRFELHVDAYFGHKSCTDVWSAPDVTCHGVGSTNPGALDFRASTDVKIFWCLRCRAADVVPDHPRFMELCANATCSSYLTGKVVMPNGPFLVLGGKLDGKNVLPDDRNQARFGQPGGPLALYTGFHSKFKVGFADFYSYGYVFKLNGYLKLES